MPLRALVLTGYGINCENESKYAIEKNGGKADILLLNRLLENSSVLDNYNMLMIPGGFSFGDDLGSGRVFGNRLKFKLREPIERFIHEQKLVLGICNGFQILVKMGLLPIPDFIQRVSLINNDSGHFDDRWVILKINKASPCVFTRGLDYLHLPVRHGEGKFIVDSKQTLEQLKAGNLDTLWYADNDGKPTNEYPANPNGSMASIAGICDQSGRIFGMMPHPEAFNIPENSPIWPKGTIKEAYGLRIFRNAIEYAQTQGF